MGKKIIVIIAIVALIGGGLFYLYNKKEEPKEVKPQAVAEDIEKTSEEKEKVVMPESVKKLNDRIWKSENALGDDVTVYFDTTACTVKRITTNEYDSYEYETTFSYTEDGKTLIVDGKEYKFKVDGDTLIYDGVKYKALDESGE